MQRISAEEYKRLKEPGASPKRTPPDVRALGRMPKGVMNKTEERYAIALDADPDIAWWAFEAVKLILAPNTSITVDFFIMRQSQELEAHDVKAGKHLVTDDARAKMKVAANMFPFPFFYAWPSDAGFTTERVGRG